MQLTCFVQINAKAWFCSKISLVEHLAGVLLLDGVDGPEVIGVLDEEGVVPAPDGHLLVEVLNHGPEVGPQH